MRIFYTTLGLITCRVLSGFADGAASHAAGSTNAVAVATEKIWAMYAQVFARDLSGPERATERAVAFAQVMTNHAPTALVRLSPVQRPGRSAIGRISGIRLPEYGSASMGAFLVQVIRYAYEVGPEFPQSRILIPDGLGTSRYDYLDTMPKGGPEVLRRALKEQFGLVARREVSPGAGGESVESLIVEKNREQ